MTRQTISNWETGETTPNTDTLKLLSKLFDVSINTLLGSPRELINVCVGHMVTEEFSKEQAREYMKQLLPKLDYWKRYEEYGF